jgi:hypothetical protein
MRVILEDAELRQAIATYLNTSKENILEIKLRRKSNKDETGTVSVTITRLESTKG